MRPTWNAPEHIQRLTRTHHAAVNVSGGAPSAAALYRTIATFGPSKTIAIFADTRAEDEDVYRFLNETCQTFGAHLITLQDGRTPWELFHAQNCMGNARLDLCSRILKRELIDNWLKTSPYQPSNTIRVFGFGHDEPQRQAKIADAVKPYSTWCPLCDPPYLTSCAARSFIEDDLDIPLPELYHSGFPHANCGGACVKAGHGAWHHLLNKRPETFYKWAEEEKRFRERTGKNVSILRDRRGGPVKPLTLYELARRIKEEGYRPTDIGGTCDCYGLND